VDFVCLATTTHRKLDWGKSVREEVLCDHRLRTALIPNCLLSKGRGLGVIDRDFWQRILSRESSASDCSGVTSLVYSNMQKLFPGTGLSFLESSLLYQDIHHIRAPQTFEMATVMPETEDHNGSQKVLSFVKMRLSAPKPSRIFRAFHKCRDFSSSSY
jgi:hypothetical protein